MHVVLEVEGEPFELWLVREGPQVRLEVGGATQEARVRGEGRKLTVEVAGKAYVIELVDERHARIDGQLVEFRVPFFAPGGAPGQHEEEQGGARIVKPPMPGRIAAVKVHEGEQVQKGQVLLVLEAMKMQNEVPSPRAGKVAHVRVKQGDVVDANTVLVELED